MAKVLTAKAIAAARPDPTRRREIPDAGMTGLYLVVQPGGAKSWAVRYRFAGRPRKLALGRYPVVTLADARDKAIKALKQIDGGIDPAVTRKAEQATAADDRDHFERVLDLFIERHAKQKNRSWRETERVLRREALPVWKGRKIGDITKRNVIDLIDGIAERAPAMANRTFAAVRKMFAWCRERDMIMASPCAGLRAPSPEVARDRVLSDTELSAIWMACETLNYPSGPLFRLLILTGQRRAEVAEARWDEFDLAAATWMIPAARAKNGKAHEVPLSPEAIKIIQALPCISGKPSAPAFLFTTTGDTPFSGFSKAKRRLDDLVSYALHEGASQPVQLPPWRLHDLRRTMASDMAALGVNLPVIERILNHVSGSFGGIVGVYQRHEFSAEKRAALKIWAAYVKRIVEGDASENVVELRPAAVGD